MKALISPQESNRIAEVLLTSFPVAEPLYWVDCPDNCQKDWTYVNGQFIESIPYQPNADENKQAAMLLLQQTDWTTIADVSDPAKSNPYLTNADEFVTYRNAIRQYAINPIAGNLNWPVVPNENWQTI